MPGRVALPVPGVGEALSGAGVPLHTLFPIQIPRQTTDQLFPRLALDNKGCSGILRPPQTCPSSFRGGLEPERPS